MIRRSAALAVVGVTAVGVVTLSSTVAIAAASGALHRSPLNSSLSCVAPQLPGTVIDVTLMDSGHMMGTRSGTAATHGRPGFPMRLLASSTSVPAGTVSFRVHNAGARTHELLVLPRGEDSDAGRRPVGRDGRMDEAGNLAESSRSCGAGRGEGLRPGSVGWVSLPLTAGSYELVCDVAGHYVAGMSAGLTATGPSGP